MPIWLCGYLCRPGSSQQDPAHNLLLFAPATLLHLLAICLRCCCIGRLLPGNCCHLPILKAAWRDILPNIRQTTDGGKLQHYTSIICHELSGI